MQFLNLWCWQVGRQPTRGKPAAWAGRPDGQPTGQTEITERQLNVFFLVLDQGLFKSTYTLKTKSKTIKDQGKRRTDGAHICVSGMVILHTPKYIGYGKQRGLNTLDTGSQET
jgi:hypothetical protein